MHQTTLNATERAHTPRSANLAAKAGSGFLLLLCLLLGTQTNTHAQDVILQGFYWNSHPGDISNGADGGIWWDTLATLAPQIGDAGFETVWTPPPTKGFAGRFDMGYGPYDYFDLGEFDSKGTIRTRHGSRAELDAMIAALHANGVKVMADIVLNHRAGGDAQAFEEAGPDFRFLIFNPPSGRLPSGPEDFHPNNFHSDENPPFRDPIFFEDVCYFNNVTSTPPTDAAGNPGNWYFGAPNIIGEMGVDLIGWGRFLKDVGFDEIRLDAVKHIEPDYLAKFIVEYNNGPQAFALGEFFDFNAGAITSYHNLVETSTNSGAKNADMSMFDFPFRGVLQAILNDGSGGQDLFQALGGAGLVWGSSLSGDDVVTWLDTHDTDRTGFVGDDEQSCEIPFGNSCLKFETEPDHNPVFQDKEDMGYPVLMAAEGRPLVFWKDYFWFGLDKDIKWLMALRAAMATGASDHIQNMAGFWPTAAPYDFDNNGGNMFAMRRDGATGGVSDGLVLGLNDHPSKTNAVFVNTPFTNKYLKDYSDGFLFETTQAFGDSRALIKAQPRDYSWYAPTGLYPQPPDAAGSHFSMDATPGGCPHFIALTVADANNFIVNGAPIDDGDEVAVKNAAGQVVGIGRIGQSFQWDGEHDMIIEVLGAPAANGLADGETFRLFVYDAGTGQELEAGSLSYAAAGVSFQFSPDRPNSPNRNGGIPTFPVETSATGTFSCAGISQLTGFSTDACSITSITAGQQFPCNPDDNTYNQELTIFYVGAPGPSLVVNGETFPVTGSPQTVLLQGLVADGAPVSATASLAPGCELTVADVFIAPPTCGALQNCEQSNAAAAAYDDGWQSGDNDGAGFGSWNLFTQNNNPSTAGHFVFTSTDNGDGDSNGDGDIDTAGEAWGLYANSGDVSNAVRPFNNALVPGGAFSLSMDNGWIDGGAVGFGLQNASFENRFEFFFRGGASTYEYVDAGGLQNIPGLFFSDEGLNITFNLTGTDSYTATITRLEDGSVFNISGTLSGVANSTDISQVRLFNANAGPDGQRNAYFNSLEICAPLPDCAITGVTAGAQTACNSTTNTYSQTVTVTYENAPPLGQLEVNGQFFPVTGSPQAVTLTGLDADGQPVDVTAAFSATPACSFTAAGLFTAPEACPPCAIIDLTALAQTACAPNTNEYTQEVRVTYTNQPATGLLDVNGQTFPITGSPQVVTLTGLDSDGQPVAVTASFTDDPGCSLTEPNVFTAPEACPPCVVTNATVGAQSTCLALTNTYTQEVTVEYANNPADGFLVVNGQYFPVTGSPQTVTLAGLPSDGAPVDLSVSFTGDAACTFTLASAFTAPASCLAASACAGDAADDGVYDDNWQSGDNGGAGFTGWVLNTQNNDPSTAGHFVFTSTDNGNQNDTNGDGDIDANGEAWGLYANSGDVSEAVRPFAEPLTPNAQLRFGFDNGFIATGGTVGFGLRNAAGENLMEAFFIGGEANYVVNDGNGARATGVGFTDEGLTFTIALRDAATYEMRIEQRNGGFSQTVTGPLLNPAGGQTPAQIRFFNADAGFGGAANLYVNSLELCRLSCDLTVTDQQPSCPGGATGSVSVSVASNAFPITYGFTGGADVSLNSNTFELNNLAAGNYTITATDANGCSSSVGVIIIEGDDTPPEISCPENIIVANDPDQCGANVDFTATATDNCDALVQYNIDPGAFFPVGTAVVTATATDVGGNQAACDFSVTVQDTQAPTITCPDDVNVSNDAGDCGAAVEYAPVVTDNCGADFSLQSGLAGGSLFPVGTTTVILAVADDAGNTGTACSFDVTVNDTEAPAPDCQPITVQLGAEGTYSLTGDDLNAIAGGSSDNCRLDGFSADPMTFSCVDLGTQTVTITVLDENGNDATCQAQVTVAGDALANADGDALPDVCDPDDDNDNIADEDDNCPLDANGGQADSDGDGVGNKCDNCPNDPNSGQADNDGDGIGNVCDPCPDFSNDIDTDGDGVSDCLDNCDLDANGGQADSDGDGVGNKCDNCPNDPNSGQADNDGDGIGNVCDPCPDFSNDIDTDGDGVSDCLDNCDLDANGGQADSDGDGVGNKCDNCPNDPNGGQADNDGDGIGNVCDPCPDFSNDIDTDGDGVSDCLDNCDLDANGGQADSDGDGVGNKCDNCPNDPNSGQADDDGDGIGNVCDPCPDFSNDIDTDGDGVSDCLDNCDLDANGGQADSDGDGVGNKCDNCPDDPNSGQADNDGDGIGNVCDACPDFSNDIDTDGDGVSDCLDNCDLDANGGQADSDGDGVGNKCDNCPDDPNGGQADDDGDGIGNVCDACPDFSNDIDTDGDGVSDCLDNCDLDANGGQADSDGDGVGNKCDNCPDDPNGGQADDDGDGIGNVCDPCPDFSNDIDTDGDGVSDCLDNCDLDANGGQADSDGDGVGNKCDNCPNTPNPGQNDTDEDGVGDACDPTLDSYAPSAETDQAQPLDPAKRDFGLYPNPTRSMVTIGLAAYLGETVEIRIHDTRGALIYRQELDAVELPAFDIQLTDGSFRPGVYLVSVVVDGYRTTKQLVVLE